MEIPLQPHSKQKSISFKELLSRLGLHIASQIIMTTSAGLMSLKTDDWKAVTVFVLLVVGNGLSVLTAFIDKSSSNYVGASPKKPNSDTPPIN